MISKEWNTHYSRDKSLLTYPDENLVRLLSKELRSTENNGNLRAVDIGCGSGRHMALLGDSGIEEVFGTDYSLNALQTCREIGLKHLVNCDNSSLPFSSETFDIAVAWGSLHYSSKSNTGIMISEILRVMKKGSPLFATLRRDNDTYLKTGTHIGSDTWKTGLDDLTGTTASFFSESELKDYFKAFGRFEYGWMERTVIGDTSKIISHWIISARK